MRKRKGNVGTRRDVAGWDVEEIEISEEKLKEKERKIKWSSAVRRIENFWWPKTSYEGRGLYEVAAASLWLLKKGNDVSQQCLSVEQLSPVVTVAMGNQERNFTVTKRAICLWTEIFRKTCARCARPQSVVRAVWTYCTTAGSWETGRFCCGFCITNCFVKTFQNVSILACIKSRMVYRGNDFHSVLKFTDREFVFIFLRAEGMPSKDTVRSRPY